ncbi:hypothetical protein FQN55_009094 [Onygenales sp. PD_40]|nr:hypothetical protein FQN55_009094 [Onygenales sp. PD_40]KAK2788015.1 hypothetical protein FQN53_004212 [Emmonsiellopsis sp. PD_33]
MTLKDILRKKDKHSADNFNTTTTDPNPSYSRTSSSYSRGTGLPPSPPPGPEFRFFRTDTHTQEAIQPPGFDQLNPNVSLNPSAPAPTSKKRLSRFRRSSNASHDISGDSSPSNDLSPARDKGERRLSQRLHLTRSSRSASTSSVNLPADLPQIGPDTGDAQEREAQWEKRATMLVQGTVNLNIRPSSPLADQGRGGGLEVAGGQQRRSRSPSVNDPQGDANIQEAIRLHEAGELTASTRMFGILANPNGANNALSQVLYGLALRHGWGCAPDPKTAVSYLSAAASNSASVEEEALRAGMKKGGAAKGELVLAIFELANCFRNGWGVAKDPAAARQYYETAANLGDTDAMNEAAWCFLEGFGGKKDRYMAAKYYRLAEEHGSKTLGNTW